MTTKTKPKRLLEYTAFVLLLGTGLAVAQLAFEGNNIDGVQVIAGKNSSTGKTLVPKVDPATGGLVVAGTITASTTGLATSAKQDTELTAIRTFNANLGATADSSATTDTGTFSLIALTKRIAAHLTRLWQGPTASCAHYRSTTTSVSAGSSGTSIDAGATGTGYWTAASNLSRTYDIEINTDTGAVRVPPGGTVTFSYPAAATPDSVTVKTNGAGTGGAATNVTVMACDDD